MSPFASLGDHGLLLEAEVAPSVQAKFEGRYTSATKLAVSPGNPQHYQNQMNKWGAELRVYFNDPGMAVVLAAINIHVEHSRSGYLAGEYLYRFNNAEMWWKLVEEFGLRLGPN